MTTYPIGTRLTITRTWSAPETDVIAATVEKVTTTVYGQTLYVLAISPTHTRVLMAGELRKRIVSIDALLAGTPLAAAA